jgi:GNAT superfamily N-acetyltransferase
MASASERQPPGSSGIDVTRIAPLDWKVLRDLRLHALAEAPSVLVGDVAAERTWSPDRWQLECETACWFCASWGGDNVGLGRVVDYPGENPRLHLEVMWVDPRSRRSGVGEALVQAAESYCRQNDEHRLGLWIVASNHDAEMLYKSLGYGPTGRQDQLADGRPETELSRSLT